MSPDDPTTVRYRFGPLQQRGVLAGWRGGQIAVGATGLIGCVLVLRALPSVGGVVVSIVVVGTSVAIATWPINGRTAEQWAPDAVRYVTGLRPGQARRDSRDPFEQLRILSVDLGPRSPVDRGSRLHNWAGDLAQSTSSSSFGKGPEVAVVVDRATRTYTAVLKVRGPGFVLLSRQSKDQRISGWANVLASMARQGSPVRRLQWVEQSLPDGGEDIRSHVSAARVLGPDSAAGHSYDALVQQTAPVTYKHQVLLAVSVRSTRRGRGLHIGRDGDAESCSALLREVTSLCRQLDDSSHAVESVVGSRELSHIFQGFFSKHTTLDPVASAAERASSKPELDVSPNASRARRAGPTGSVPQAALWPWPMGMQVGWSRLRADGTWHATYWVAEWPRIDSPADFLGPLLLMSDVRRSMSVIMEPVPPVQAAREVERQRTADVADAELRRRGGFISTARRRSEEETLERREAELADGHGQFRFCGYVTVTGNSEVELDEVCRRAEQAAGKCGIELRLCYGDQRSSFTCTMPLGRGLD